MDGGFVATLDDGSTVAADTVLAAPGIRHFVNLPAWSAEVPPARRGHTSEIVAFDRFAGARVVIIGGRQSAYEWAALLCDHGAEHVDVVHRHTVPDFAKVSWAFVDACIDSTLAQRGWWRRLRPSGSRRSRTPSGGWAGSPSSPGSYPRMAPDAVTRHPGTEVTGVAAGAGDVTLTLSNGTARVNVNGGAVALGHPLGASGFRLLQTSRSR